MTPTGEKYYLIDYNGRDRVSCRPFAEYPNQAAAEARCQEARSRDAAKDYAVSHLLPR